MQDARCKPSRLKWKRRLQVTGRPLAAHPPWSPRLQFSPTAPPPPLPSPPLPTGLGPWTRHTMGIPLDNASCLASPQCRVPVPRTSRDSDGVVLGFNGQHPLPRTSCLFLCAANHGLIAFNLVSLDTCKEPPTQPGAPGPEPCSRRLRAPRRSLLGNGPGQ
jgi:hypothetical protein